MSDICAVCGLPADLCICSTLAKEKQDILVMIEKKRYGKNMTVIKGIDVKSIDLKDVAKKLKSKLACGGTAKDGKIELQGDHIKVVPGMLVDLGFARESISVKHGPPSRRRKK